MLASVIAFVLIFILLVFFAMVITNAETRSHAASETEASKEFKTANGILSLQSKESL